MTTSNFSAGRDVAIVGFAQTKHVRSEDTLSEVELIQPVIAEAMAQVGLDHHGFDFYCSGSSDYLAGQAFSFVMTLDAIGAWPPVAESHVEMDGAWALYEAYLKIRSGHADTALVYGYGKSSPGDLTRVLSRMCEPYYTAPLWPTSVELAALQARACIEAGITSEAEMAEVAARDRRSAQNNPNAQLAWDRSADDVLAGDYLANPLRRDDCAPITDGGAAIVLASPERAAELCARPAWITGLDHRIDAHSLSVRDLTRAPSARLAAEGAGVGDGPVDVAELHTCFTHHEAILRNELGLGDDVPINPSGGPLAANPMMAAGMIRIGEVANRIFDGSVNRGVAHATGGHLMQHNLVAVLDAAQPSASDQASSSDEPEGGR
ncbi:MAG: thiolase domain-containing protein [Candidatus Microthrix subdominans]